MRTLAIKYKDPRKLKPRLKNPRTHTVRQIKQIAASILEFGFINPVLLDGSDCIVAGHARSLHIVSVTRSGLVLLTPLGCMMLFLGRNFATSG